MQLEQLQRRNLDLQKENEDLRAKLSRAISERDAAVARARALDQQVQELMGRVQQPSEPVDDEWRRSGMYTWTELSSEFLFDSGKATLRPAARAKLQDVVSTIQSRYPNMDVWVIGHTDTDPIKVTKAQWQDNLDLSCNRGMSIYRELMHLGITPARMIAGGQGEYFPVASNASRAGKQQNRRVDIVVVPQREARPIETPAVEESTPTRSPSIEREPAREPAPRTTPPAPEDITGPATD
jgi:chemotaxis protein MotB